MFFYLSRIGEFEQRLSIAQTTEHSPARFEFLVPSTVCLSSFGRLVSTISHYCGRLFDLHLILVLIGIRVSEIRAKYQTWDWFFQNI